ncbi:hypothetical protein BaRGS_00002534 [Batillaria attramentaria]|uniref:Uncharacterized protein n=1 Tax=Batillaria attramentaria TaxID=370345 RepID=A0ABD0M449_9CAEN
MDNPALMNINLTTASHDVASVYRQCALRGLRTTRDRGFYWRGETELTCLSLHRWLTLRAWLFPALFTVDCPLSHHTGTIRCGARTDSGVRPGTGTHPAGPVATTVCIAFNHTR